MNVRTLSFEMAGARPINIYETTPYTQKNIFWFLLNCPKLEILFTIFQIIWKKTEFC